MSALFGIKGKVIVITGATGTLTGSAADYLAGEGARVVYLGRSQEKLDVALAKACSLHPEAEVMGVVADVANRAELEQARDTILATWGRVDALTNGAGGNQPGATITPDKTFADLDFAAFEQVVALNHHGTVLPTLAFSPALLAAAPGASVIHFLLADASRFVTGTTLVVDGGFIMDSGV